MGCYYDEKDKLWKVYENGERGRSMITFSSESENDALAELYKIVRGNLITMKNVLKWREGKK